MLEKLSDNIRECFERAAEARALADATDDPALKAEYLNAERRWLTLARSYGFVERLEDFTAVSAKWRREVDARLQGSAKVAEVRTSLDGPDDIIQLHEISTLLIQEDNLESLYSRILDAAATLMASDASSLQALDPARNQLRLLASRGFHPRSAIFWEWVHLDSASTCGLAMHEGRRVFVPDVLTCDFMAGTPDLDEYRRSDIRAVQSTPLVSRSGQLLGMISTHWREPHQPHERALRRLDLLARQAADLIERGRIETTLRERNEQLLRLASIVEATDDAIVTKTLDGVITSWNKSAERLFGYAAQDIIGKPAAILMPPERFSEESTILERIGRGERIEHYDTVNQRSDGKIIDVSLTVSPVKNAEGEIIGASRIARDITERKQNDERVAMFAREAEHRTRNILTVVQAIVELSSSDTPDGLKRAIERRVAALARLQDLFIKSHWTGAELYRIAAQELAPYMGENAARVFIDGPHVALAPNSAQAIAVILHELATNAVKYGSLSAPEGKVEVTWRRAADEKLILSWIESGGPPVKAPARRGFGTTITETMTRGLSEGRIRLDWRAEGFACEIAFRL